MGRKKKPGGPRKDVMVQLPISLRERARDLKINLSELLEKALKMAIKEKEKEKP